MGIHFKMCMIPFMLMAPNFPPSHNSLSTEQEAAAQSGLPSAMVMVWKVLWSGFSQAQILKIWAPSFRKTSNANRFDALRFQVRILNAHQLELVFLFYMMHIQLFANIMMCAWPVGCRVHPSRRRERQAVQAPHRALKGAQQRPAGLSQPVEEETHGPHDGGASAALRLLQHSC